MSPYATVKMNITRGSGATFPDDKLNKSKLWRITLFTKGGKDTPTLYWDHIRVVAKTFDEAIDKTRNWLEKIGRSKGLRIKSCEYLIDIHLI